VIGAVTIPGVTSAYAEAGTAVARAIPIEAPIAIEINGLAYAVMMATPIEIEDFVTGFLLSEDLATRAELGPVAVHRVVNAELGDGYVARTNVPAHRAAPLMERARRRVSDSACGLCGMESIELALRPLPILAPQPIASARAIRQALLALPDHQPLGRHTGATHAAVFCDNDGRIVVGREDVGRHNALDKIIGALARQGCDASAGFIVVTSRCSFELVEKAVRANCPLLVSISAPTDLAVRRARAAGLALAVLARDDSLLWVSGPAVDYSLPTTAA
jgi:FdhD protein